MYANPHNVFSKLEGQLNLPSPLQRLESNLLRKDGIEVYIKRDDLIHPEVSGNKWRKLKHNLLEAFHHQSAGIATVGGAYSNHMAATAQIASLLQIPALGFIKSHSLDEGNPTVTFCREKGMQLEVVSRGLSDETLTEKASDKGLFFVPEGGSNALGVKGVSELLEELPKDLEWDYIFTSVGSGGTMAGLANGLQSQGQLCGVSSFPTVRIQGMLKDRFALSPKHYHHFDQYRFGGFGKYDSSLIQFADRFYHQHQIILDPIYTSKTMYALLDLIALRWIPRGSRILFLHTGGIQGWQGFAHRFHNKPLPAFLSLRDDIVC